MSEDPIVTLRRVSVAAGVGALRLDGFTLEPLFAAFPMELVHHFTLGATAGLDALRVRTRASGEDGAERLLKLLVDVYQASEAAVAAAGDLAAQLGYPDVEIEVEEPRDAVEPRLRFRFVGRFDRATVGRTLSLLDVAEAARDAVDRAMGLLGADTAQSIGLAMDRPGAPPRYEVTVPGVHTSDDRATFAGALTTLLAGTAVSARQQKFIVAMFGGLTARPMESTPVTLVCDRERLLDDVRVAYFNLPATLALRVLQPLDTEKRLGEVLGVLAGAVQLKSDVVSCLEVGAWAGEPPRVGFELRAPGPPTV